jgi:hypothetical protein
MRTICFRTAALVALTLWAGAAWADAIDGEWCHPDGRRLSIRGPLVVTPGGAQLQGDYTRHNFSYIVPSSELPAGQTVFMTLMNEYTVHLRIGTTTEHETWKRCAPSVSEARPPAMPPV